MMGQGGERGRTAARGRGRDQQGEGTTTAKARQRRPNDETPGRRGGQRGGKATKKGPRDVVSWAVGKFFFFLFP